MHKRTALRPRGWWVGLIWAACSQPPPTPAPLAPDAGARGARVRFGAVEGYLARPLHAAEERSGEIWQADVSSPALQLQARVHASTGVRVLIIHTGIGPEAAQDYLGRLSPALQGIGAPCAGPCPTQSPAP